MFLLSCSKDDSKNSNLSGSIQDEWKLAVLEYVGFTESRIDGMNMRTDYEGFAENINATTIFHANGTFESQGTYDVILTGEGMTIPYENLITHPKEITKYPGASRR